MCRERTPRLLRGARMMVPARALGLRPCQEIPGATHNEAMDSAAVTLQIKLEEVGGTTWWAGVIATLT